MALQSKTQSSLIQGISQQAPFARNTASCEDQENCLNDPLDGVVARMGTVPIEGISLPRYVNPAVHEIIRNDSEHYWIGVEGNTIRAWNITSGQECSITGAASLAGYLSGRGNADNIQFLTVGDTTFLLNREKVVSMSNELSPYRQNRGTAYIRAGGYKLKYRLIIRIGSPLSGTDYVVQYQTPDNSTAANAEFIGTDYIAQQFENALYSTVLPAIAADGRGQFTVARYGSTLIITGVGTWTLRSSDGVGDSHLIAFKESVDSLAKLPQRSVEGYTVAIAPPGAANKDKFWLYYTGPAQLGEWNEVPQPNIPISLNASTMPYVLTLTGKNKFTLAPGLWGKRVSGNGFGSSPDPSFVGWTIQSMQFLGGRLSLTTEFATALSKARNAYVYFPDTAQTTLDSDPVDYDISNGATSPISRSVVAGGRLMFWGDKQQTYLETGQEAIKQDTTDILPLANYEYDGYCPPKPLGMSSVLFGTSIGRYGRLTETFFSKGIPQGEIVITGHVPKLLKGRIKHIAASDASSKVLVITTGNGPNTVWLYQAYNQGQDRIQSAWNRWTFPAVEKVLWASVHGDTAYFLFQWNDRCTIERLIMDNRGEGILVLEEDDLFPLRLDHRLASFRTPKVNGKVTLALPYPVFGLKQNTFRAVAYNTVNDGVSSQRGKELNLKWNNPMSITVDTPHDDIEFVFGSIPTATRKFTRFMATDRNDDPIHHEKLLIKDVVVGHTESVQYSVVVSKRDAEMSTEQQWIGRSVGDPTPNNEVVVEDGTFKVHVEAETEDVEITLKNDSAFPSIWTSMKYIYDLEVGKA